MYNKLIEYKRKCIFHFTDNRNISNIIEHKGLFSYDKLVENNLDNIYYGGNEWSHDADHISKVSNYVHCCFLDNHPMQYIARNDGRIKETKWIEISIDIIKLSGVKYTMDVSNKSGIELMDEKTALKYFDFEAIFKWIDFSISNNQKRKCNAEKYEILIPDFIPISYIKNI